MFAATTAADDRTRLWAALHPGELPEHRRLAYDQVNLAWATTVALHQLGGSREPFRPLYSPPGSIWADMVPSEQGALSEYVRMTEDDCRAWLASLPAWQGRAVPAG